MAKDSGITSMMALRIANKLRFIARSFSTANELIFRNTTAKELETIARRAIQEGRHVGLHDFPCAFVFDPKSIYLGEVTGQLATQVSVISYPKHHYHIGGLIITVTEKYRRKGYALRSICKAIIPVIKSTPLVLT